MNAERTRRACSAWLLGSLVALLGWAAEAADGDVEAVVRLSAKQVWTDEDEPDRPREERWDIYLYLDGDLIAWTRPTLQGEPVEATGLPAPERDTEIGTETR